MKIRITATNQEKNVFSVNETDGKYEVQFVRGGKKYTYHKDKIELLNRNSVSRSPNSFLNVYKYSAPCYKCSKPFDILTYITFEGSKENLIYPWDKNRLNREKSLQVNLLHMEDESIEYYPISVIGSIPSLDKLIMDKFPEKIRLEYSQTVDKTYPMNICPNCGAKKGNFYVYKDVNQLIFKMQKLEIVEVLNCQPNEP